MKRTGIIAVVLVVVCFLTFLSPPKELSGGSGYVASMSTNEMQARLRRVDELASGFGAEQVRLGIGVPLSCSP